VLFRWLSRERPVRITLEISPAVDRRLQDLSMATSMTRLTLIRRALALYDFAVRQQAEGRELHIVDLKAETSTRVPLDLESEDE